MASSPDSTENNLIYTFSFDRTDESNTSIGSVKGLLLFVYMHNNNKTLCNYKIKIANKVRWSSFTNASLKWTVTQWILNEVTWDIYIYIYRKLDISTFKLNKCYQNQIFCVKVIHMKTMRFSLFKQPHYNDKNPTSVFFILFLF